jgi:hypothetical protein
MLSPRARDELFAAGAIDAVSEYGIEVNFIGIHHRAKGEVGHADFGDVEWLDFIFNAG